MIRFGRRPNRPYYVGISIFPQPSSSSRPLFINFYGTAVNMYCKSFQKKRVFHYIQNIILNHLLWIQLLPPTLLEIFVNLISVSWGMPSALCLPRSGRSSCFLSVWPIQNSRSTPELFRQPFAKIKLPIPSSSFRLERPAIWYVPVPPEDNSASTDILPSAADWI